MSKDFLHSNSNIKTIKYQNVLEQYEAITANESNLLANLSNLCAILKQEFDWHWVGAYLVDNETELVLGPFQGPIACTRIAKGKGVCGTAWLQDSTIIVPNVHEFPGHIACSSLSQSEIVIPLKKENKIWGVLDIDSVVLGALDQEDERYLKQLIDLLQKNKS